MPHFVLYAIDGPDSIAIRKTTRPAHLEFLAGLGARYKAGSPLLAADGATSIGSMVVIEAPDLAEAEATYGEDPFMKAGLWSRVEIRQLGSWTPK
jgi:uncharacterized protein YciI